MSVRRLLVESFDGEAEKRRMRCARSAALRLAGVSYPRPPFPAATTSRSDASSRPRILYIRLHSALYGTTARLISGRLEATRWPLAARKQLDLLIMGRLPTSSQHMMSHVL